MQFVVYRLDAVVGSPHQALEFGGDLRLKVVFQHFAFACRQQFAALGNVLGQQ
ncbi:hypothetical protein D3C85_1755390 [compost metagenome]